jgi:hypothetical protein
MSSPARHQENATPAEMPESDHEAWVRRKIGAALRRKAEGRATYKPLRDIVAKYARKVL